MSRSHRLFDLLQILRRHRGAVTGATLAREAGVSLRTIRRDIATLQATGANIDGEAGVGYVLRPDALLPPLSFTEEELHALFIGAQWVARQTDHALATAVGNALAKIDAVLAPQMRSALDDSSFYVGGRPIPATGLDLQDCRTALREQRKMRLVYRDDSGISDTIVWPIMLRLDEVGRSLAAWCETRHEFRVFLAERIADAALLPERYPRNRRQLVKEWRASARHPCSHAAAQARTGAGPVGASSLAEGRREADAPRSLAQRSGVPRGPSGQVTRPPAKSAHQTKAGCRTRRGP